MVNRVAESLLEGLFPNHCVLCGLRSHRTVPLCAACQAELQVNSCCCQRCAIPLPPPASNNRQMLCGHCLHQPPPFDRVIAPWLYDEHLAHLIQRWKYHGERRLTPLLAHLWLQQAPAPTAVDLLIPIPLHWRRLWRRGFNQSELLCRLLRRSCPGLSGAPLNHRLLRRQRATAPQSGMNATQRMSNLSGAFTVSRSCDNLRVAIVDDVLTTGATATAAARALTAAGASHIEVWCLARTPAPGF